MLASLFISFQATVEYDSGVLFDGELTCKRFALFGNSTGTYIRCAGAHNEEKPIVYMALSAIVIFGGCGSLFVVKLIRDYRAKVIKTRVPFSMPFMPMHTLDNAYRLTSYLNTG